MRVTKKISKEFSKTESRILGALSKLEEFLLNAQVRTSSVTVPGTSSNKSSENRETTGDRSSEDPYPEVGYFPHHSGHLNSPETETNPHRNSRGQNTLDAETIQDYISQVSEEIEGRVTKKLSKEFSRTESRILGALSKLDEFLLNPQVRTCSVAVPGTSRNNNSENRETTRDRSSDDPCFEVRYSSHQSGHLNSPEAEDYPHNFFTTLLTENIAERLR